MRNSVNNLGGLAPNFASTKRPSVYEKLTAILKEQPYIQTATELKSEYFKKHGKRPDHLGVIRALQEREAVTAHATDPDFQTQQTEDTTAVVAETETTTESSDFVPESLLENIETIATVMAEAGGFKNARYVADAINKVGGVDNFKRALDLLERIPPTKPQITTDGIRSLV